MSIRQLIQLVKIFITLWILAQIGGIFFGR